MITFFHRSSFCPCSLPVARCSLLALLLLVIRLLSFLLPVPAFFAYFLHLLLVQCFDCHVAVQFEIETRQKGSIERRTVIPRRYNQDVDEDIEDTETTSQRIVDTPKSHRSRSTVHIDRFLVFRKGKGEGEEVCVVRT